MSDELIRMLLGWLPFVLIMGAYFIYATYARRGYKRHIDRVEAINDRLVHSNNEIIAELREIKEILRDRT